MLSVSAPSISGQTDEGAVRHLHLLPRATSGHLRPFQATSGHLMLGAII